MRSSGQYVKNAVPMIHFCGTGPQKRLSSEIAPVVTHHVVVTGRNGDLLREEAVARAPVCRQDPCVECAPQVVGELLLHAVAIHVAR